MVVLYETECMVRGDGRCVLLASSQMCIADLYILCSPTTVVDTHDYNLWVQG